MDLDLQEETGKDKRLLVLLAFGLITLLVRIPDLLPEREMLSRSWAWLEEEGAGGSLRRMAIDGDRVPKTLLPATNHELSISPRLSFLLGRSLAVNRATEDELALLAGIGPKLAASIVSYREEHGRIGNVAELHEIPGIGRQLAERLAPQLSFE